MRPTKLRQFALIVITAIALSSVSTFVAGCAGKARHATVVTDATLHQVISDIHGIEQTALCGKISCAGTASAPIAGWSDEKSKAFNKKLLPAAEAGRQLNTRLATWQAGQPVPAEVQQLIQGLSQSLSTVTVDFPAGPSRESLLTKIAQAEQIALATLNSILTVAAAAK